PTGRAEHRRQQELLTTVGAGVAQAPPTRCTKGRVLAIGVLAGRAWSHPWGCGRRGARRGCRIRREGRGSRLIRKYSKLRHKPIPVAALRLDDALRLSA